MLPEKETTRLSKLLSLVLRHDPAHLGIVLDEQGWTDVATLLTQLRASGQPLSAEQLAHIVETSPKQRFRLNDDRTRIRASQGHSVAVELGLVPVVPPEILYHGTAAQHQEAILRDGVQRMSRRQVHLSADVATARTVGSRHGQPVIFTVAARAMHQAGRLFYQADNGVWLTDEVPAVYLQVAAENT
ncbi:MAG: RNA 2'-phosphotransferase [Hymenobacter sp.]|nr:RNA 2'-phosphotransferase [Hymenobacter sp.]